MTKKFWSDWQNRIGETKNVFLNNIVYDNNGNCYYHYLLSNVNGKDKILKATFHKNTVDLVIERHTTVFNKASWSVCHHVENVNLTIHRTNIKTIEF